MVALLAEEVGSSGEPAGEVAATTAAECSDDRENLTQLPFQLQIVYTDACGDGAKAMRLLTQSKPVTDERSVAEQNINVAVLGSQTAHLSATLAKKGEYRQEARLNALIKQRLVARKKWKTPSMREGYNLYHANVSPLEGYINSMQKKERAECGNSYSDDEDDLPVSDLPTRRGKALRCGTGNKKSKESLRRAECPDELAAAMYQSANVSTKAFTKK